MKESAAEASFNLYLRYHKLPPWEREHRFAKEALGRQWRFDFAWLAQRVAAEIEGVTSYGKVIGRHQGREGFEGDCEKYNAALLLGWRVYRVPHTWVIDGRRTVWRPEIADDLRTLLGSTI